jgi:ferredoxin
MTTTIDQETCTGCELCTSSVPDVFEMDGPVAKVIQPQVPSELEDEVQEAAENCPVEAIAVA